MVAGLLAFTISANAQQVTLRINKSYEVAIDGQYYSGNTTLSNLSYGYHRVEVYSKGGFIFKRRSLVSSSSFDMRSGNTLIDVDQNGQLHIYQDNSYGRNGGYDNRDGRNYDPNYDAGKRGNGKGYGPYNNPGRGHKYGLYKNKNKKNKNKNHDRDYDYRHDD
jgi:hypothetical protein